MQTKSIMARPERPGDRIGWAAAGGVLGAILASSCCILPLVLFSLGISGAWVGNLTALAPYKPVFAAVALGALGYGFWLVHRGPAVCTEGDVCARTAPSRLVRAVMWIALILVLAALFWDWIAPVVAPLMLGL